jgi:hypothetical protein
VKRDVLPQRDGLSNGGGPTRRDASGGRERTPAPEMPAPQMPAPQMIVQRDLAEQDEPTWEVRQPNAGRSGMSRLDGRTRSILTVAAVAAIVVNAGAAWAYWKVTKSETASARAGTAVQLTLRGRSDLGRPLTPGGTGNLTVTVTNDNDFPIRIMSVAPGRGHIVADDEHRDAGCLETGVSMTKDDFAASWNVPRNTIGAFTLIDALRMAPNAKKACEGATFTVPLQTSGITQQS